MEVHYHNRSERAVAYPATRAPDLTTLAGSVDFLVIAVPGGAQTHHLIEAEVFAAMQAHTHLQHARELLLLFASLTMISVF